MRLIVGIVLMLASACAQANAQSYCKLGSQKWVRGCEANCTASWDGSNCPQQCTGTAPPGHVIIDHRDVNLSENNGGHSISMIAAGQSFDYSSDVKVAYESAINLAAKKGRTKLAANLKQDMKNAMAVAQKFSSTHQTVRLEVSASKHGSIVDRKRGWSKHRVEILVQCMVPKNLEKQLYKKYGLK